MNNSDVKKNIVFNFVKTGMSLVFPVITFAYASRILLVDGIGQINFAKSIVQYFALFASLGISTYAIREGAKIRDDKTELSRFTHEIIFINVISTIIALVLFFISLAVIPKFSDYRILLLINGITIIFAGLGVEWFYGAIEDYKYITIRSIAFQIISLILMFVFVRERNDIYKYAGIVVFSNVGSNVLNFLHLRKFIFLKRVGKYDIKRHIKSIFLFFASTLSGNIYLLLDMSMLGFLSTDTAIGLYSAANKMTKMIISIISSASTVLLPRMSYYIGNNNKSHFNIILNKAFHLIILIALPAFILMFMFSADILVLFSGTAFLEADVTAKILSMVILIIPLSTVLSNQILLPLGKEKYQLITTACGAILNICSNFILIPLLGDKGAALGTLIAETGVLLISVVLAKKTYPFAKYLTSFKNYILAAIPMILVITVLNNLQCFYLIRMCISGITGSLLYMLILNLLKDQYIKEIMGFIVNVLKRKGVG